MVSGVALYIRMQSVHEERLKIRSHHISLIVRVHRLEKRGHNGVCSLPRVALMPLTQHYQTCFLSQPRLLEIDGQAIKNTLRIKSLAARHHLGSSSTAHMGHEASG